MTDSSEGTIQNLRTWDYSVDKLDTIRSAIAGYAGGVAIAREMVQNADDARSEYIEFHFTEDALLVRNGSIFNDENFQAICKLASGSKRYDEETTGTWGTGFLSVYQITDYPELHSAGVHLTFDPERDKVEEQLSPETEGTVFRFSWRTKPTEISRYIEADEWNSEWKSGFREQLCRELYSLSPFLRHIRRLAVYSGTDKSRLDCEIQWDPCKISTLADGTLREVRTAHVNSDNCHVKHEWYFYSSRVEKQYLGLNGRQLKKRDIRFAFGVDEDNNLVSDQGLLYNFLPTPLNTGYRFHIQGDFFPDANRTTILTDTSSKAEWNRELIGSIARLFGNNLVTVRDDAPTRQIFYSLLASVIKSPQPFLVDFAASVRSIGVTQPVVWTAKASWVEPPKALIAKAPALAELAKDFKSGIASVEVPTSVVDFLRIASYTFPEFLDLIAELTKPGTPLKNADPIVRGRDRLYKILDAIEQEYQKTSDKELLTALKRTPLCLYHSGLLYPFAGYHLYCADNEVRRVFEAQSLQLIDPTFQTKYKHIIEVTGLKWADFEMIHGKMKSWGDLYGNKSLPECPKELQTIERIKQVVLYFAMHGPKATSYTGLPLCPDTEGVMACIGDFVFTADSASRSWLGKTGIRFLAEDIENDEDCFAFLRRSKHPAFGVRSLVVCMAKWFASPNRIQDAHPLFNRPTKWKRLATFLADSSTELGEDDVKRLRSIPFIPTQKGNYAPVVGEHAVLKLPPRPTEEVDTDFLNLLELDNIIDNRYTDSKVQDFLRVKLGVQSLSIIGYISNDIVRHYDRPELGHKKRLSILKLMRDTQDLRNPKYIPVFNRLQNLSLIRCSDGIYRKPTEVYMPSAELDMLLPNGYPAPHHQYGTLRRAKGSKIGPREQERWQEFFEWLGLQNHPLPSDLTAVIKETVCKPPTNNGIEHIRAAYNYLYDHWDDLASASEYFDVLKDIPWIPAADDLSHWYLPRVLYPARLRRLVESQAKILMFREPPHRMSEFFSMNNDVQVEDVVNHLMWLCENQRTSTIDSLEFLSKHLDSPVIQKLRNQPLYYDQSKDKYWVAERVMFGDHSTQLGPYFGYVTHPHATWMQTLAHLGALERLEPLRDYVTLIQDIANRFKGVPIDTNNAALLQQAYQQLSVSMNATEQQEAVLPQLSELAFVMDQGMHLQYGSETYFKDRPDLLDLFPEVVIPCALCNTDAGRDFLLQIGVRAISDVVQRSLHTVEGKELDIPLSALFRSLAPLFRRIIRSFTASFPTGWCNPESLNDVQVLRAKEIKVQYFIEANNTKVQGDIREEDAWFDPEAHLLYFGPIHGDQRSRFALARETAKILNHSLRPEVLTPVIKELLSAHDATEAKGILDEFGIAQLDLTETMFERDDLDAFTEPSTDDLSDSNKNNIIPDDMVDLPSDPPVEITPAFPLDGDSGAASVDSSNTKNDSVPAPGTPSGGGSGGHFNSPKPGSYKDNQDLEAHRSKAPADGQHSGSNTSSAKSKAGQRTFISYPAASSLDEADEDVSDSETQQERMRVEAVAIQFILTLELDLKQTRPGNPGFDLYGIGSDQQPNRWIEVKAMVGTLSKHPVGMSRRQFLEAQERETGYWLYIVESATSDEPRILKIQDPVGKAKTFTFDQGWRDIATVSGRVESTVEAEDK